MHKKIRIGKNKILFYYFLVVVLPSIILGALAFRGVINDQAINEREIRQQLTETGAKIIKEADLFLAETEKQLLRKTGVSGIPPAERIFFEDSIFANFLKKKPVIEGIFYIQSAGTVQILKSGLLYFPDGTFKQRYLVNESDLNNNYFQGWEYEFKDKNYPKALNFYRSQIKKTKNDALIASHSISVARIQKKLLNFTDAIDTYKLIEEKHGQERLTGGILLGVIALMEIGSLHLIKGDPLNALKSTNYLLSLTAKSHWALEFSQYNQLVAACDEIIKRSESCKNELCLEQGKQIISVLGELTNFVDKTNNQLVFLDNAAIVLKEPGFRSPEAESEYRIYTDVERKATLLSLFPHTGNGQWGIIYNLSQFLNQLKDTIIPNEKQNFDFQWQIIKEGRELIAQSLVDLPEDIKITSVFPPFMPSWSLVLYKESSGMITTFLRASQGIFIYIFLFIVIVLALGLFFTLQIINKELMLSKMKSDFISTVSHEFKSPLTSIRQMSEMLFSERIKTESRKKEYYAVMLEQSERLSHLIDNILDFSKIEEGKKAFRFEKIDVSEQIDHVKSVFQNSISNEGFNVSLSMPEMLPELVIDKEAIQQVIYNLLDNAYKYSGSSKNIEIVVEHTGDWVKISVKDFGVGIQREDQLKIFDRFFRGGNELTRSVKGSGIGLTIVKKIIEAHRGTVSLESTLGKGSTFIIKLPLKQED
ncbi:MAG: HAMP domain-containing histidine kinase [Prolixibacteraceae bacterium]|nr:HAMP domain-containing histidine kinase [Prolixibacteraceae bacterium]